MIEDFGLQDVTADDGQGRGGFFRRGFFDEALDRNALAAGAAGVDNAVFHGVLAFDILDGDDIAAMLVVNIHHLLQAAG